MACEETRMGVDLETAVLQQGVSPVIGTLLLGWNNALSERERQRLKPYAACAWHGEFARH